MEEYKLFIEAEFYFMDTYVDWAIRVKANTLIIKKIINHDLDVISTMLVN